VEVFVGYSIVEQDCFATLKVFFKRRFARGGTAVHFDSTRNVLKICRRDLLALITIIIVLCLLILGHVFKSISFILPVGTPNVKKSF
jgi:hypothetical protein